MSQASRWTTPPPAAPIVDFFNIVNFGRDYSPAVPSEVGLRERFGKIGIDGVRLMNEWKTTFGDVIRSIA